MKKSTSTCSNAAFNHPLQLSDTVVIIDTTVV